MSDKETVDKIMYRVDNIISYLLGYATGVVGSERLKEDEVVGNIDLQRGAIDKLISEMDGGVTE